MRDIRADDKGKWKKKRLKMREKTKTAKREINLRNTDLEYLGKLLSRVFNIFASFSLQFCEGLCYFYILSSASI